MRYQKMTEAEMERSAELWLRVEGGMSRREACERLQHEFYTRAQVRAAFAHWRRASMRRLRW